MSDTISTIKQHTDKDAAIWRNVREKGLYMGLFGKKKKLVAINTIIGRARNLSRSLQELYQSGKGDDFAEKRRVFEISGIHEYTRGHSYSNCNEMDKSSLEICVKEVFGHIISVRENLKQPIPVADTDTVSVLMFQGYDRKASLTFIVSIEAPRRKWEKQYGHLQKGSQLELDGPARLEYSFSPTGVKTYFESPYQIEESFMQFHLKIYL